MVKRVIVIILMMFLTLFACDIPVPGPVTGDGASGAGGGGIGVAHARMVNVLLYCNFRAPHLVADRVDAALAHRGGPTKAAAKEALEHWKPEIPDVGVDEVVRDFYVVARQGTKRFYHCLVDTDEANPKQFERIRNYIIGFNAGKPIAQQVLYWKGKTAEDAYKALWQDRTTDPFIETIAKKILQYPIRFFTENEDHPIKASIEDAENIYGLTIQGSVLNTCGERCIPHKFLGR